MSFSEESSAGMRYGLGRSVTFLANTHFPPILNARYFFFFGRIVPPNSCILAYGRFVPTFALSVHTSVIMDLRSVPVSYGAAFTAFPRTIWAAIGKARDTARLTSGKFARDTIDMLIMGRFENYRLVRSDKVRVRPYSVRLPFSPGRIGYLVANAYVHGRIEKRLSRIHSRIPSVYGFYLFPQRFDVARNAGSDRLRVRRSPGNPGKPLDSRGVVGRLQHFRKLRHVSRRRVVRIRVELAESGYARFVHVRQFTRGGSRLVSDSQFPLREIADSFARPLGVTERREREQRGLEFRRRGRRGPSVPV